MPGRTGPDGRSPGLHTPHFDVNGATIPLGVAYGLGVADPELGHQRA